MALAARILDFFETETALESDYSVEQKFDSTDLNSKVLDSESFSEYTPELNVDFEIIFCQPLNFAEIEHIIPKFVTGKSILLNLDLIDAYSAQRLLDYLCGSMICLEGKQTRIGENLFLFTNPGIKISEILPDSPEIKLIA